MEYYGARKLNAPLDVSNTKIRHAIIRK